MTLPKIPPQYMVLGVAGAVALYVVYRVLNKVGETVQKGIDVATTGIANAYVNATHEDVEVLGRVVLPSGTKIPLNSLAVKSDFTFVYGGVKYRVTKRRADNDYDSVKV